MKKSIKLLTAISAIFSANVFGAGTPESHILNATPRFEQLQGVVCDRNGAVPSENWNPKTIYCMMNPEPDQGAAFAYDTLEKIQKDFVSCVKGAFPQAKISTNENWHATVFTDQEVGNYLPGVLDAARQVLLNTVKPFVADLYDMYLFVVYEEGGVKKYMSFLPNSPMQGLSLKNLAESGQEALPISKLASFAPNAT